VLTAVWSRLPDVFERCVTLIESDLLLPVAAVICWKA